MKKEKIQDLTKSGRKVGELWEINGEYMVFSVAENPQLSEKLELLMMAAPITAKLQCISLEMQLTASRIKK